MHLIILSEEKFQFYVYLILYFRIPSHCISHRVIFLFRHGLLMAGFTILYFLLSCKTTKCCMQPSGKTRTGKYLFSYVKV